MRRRPRADQILRNKAKHEGLPVESADAAKRVRRAMEFAIGIVAQPPLELDFLGLSQMTSFRHRSLADELIAAETLLMSTAPEVAQCQRHLGFAHTLATKELASLSSSSAVSQVSANHRTSKSDRGLSRDIVEVAKAAD